jgi:RNA polymerase sigma-70 factor (ECF subfamily)
MNTLAIMKTSHMQTDFTIQVTRLMSALRQSALRLTKNVDDATDLVQDTLLKTYTYRDFYQPGTNLKAWLLTIMRNTFLSQCDRVKRKQRVIIPFHELGNLMVGSLPNGAVSQAQQEDIQTALAQLAMVYRESLQLHLDGFKYREIAEFLAIPIGTVKNRIYIARKELQQRLRLTS